MKYVDLHTDALTKTEGAFQVTRHLLQAGGCRLQCFAAFVQSPERGYREALALADKFDAMCESEGYRRVRTREDLAQDAMLAMLTVEGGGTIEGDLHKLEQLYLRGVRMLTLVWNEPNAIGWPNFPDYEGLASGRSTLQVREGARGLTAFGHEVVARMEELSMLVDVSHGSDKLFFEVAEHARRTHVPFVASHSGSDAVYCCARNLTDAQLRTLADCGGIVGLDFCADFLSDDKSAEGQRRAILAHAEHILRTGGEDVLALGSDFDGIPENAYMQSAACMPRLLEDFSTAFGTRIAEKIACGNAERVLGEGLKG